MKSIWMPLYVADYIADTIDLSNAEHGAYLLAMMCYWRKAGPLEESELRAICKADFDRVSKFFQNKDGKWVHKRIEFELSETNRRSEAARNRAEKANTARWGKPGQTAPPPVTNPPKTPKEPKQPAHVNGTASPGAFDTFWKAYPKPRSKGDAEKAFEKHGCAAFVDKLLKAIEWQRDQEQWTKEDGKYIPYPATWLNRKGWEDENPDEGLDANGNYVPPRKHPVPPGMPETTGKSRQKYNAKGQPMFMQERWTLDAPPLRSHWGPEPQNDSAFQAHMQAYHDWKATYLKEHGEPKTTTPATTA